MHANTSPVASHSNPAAALNLAVEWISRTGSQFMLSSSCSCPILMTSSRNAMGDATYPIIQVRLRSKPRR